LDSVSFSDRSGGPSWRRAVRLAALALSFCPALGGGAASARVLLTQEQALAEAFPALVPERRTAFLTDEQAKRFEVLSGEPAPTRVVTYYVAARDGAPAGVAWFDTHLVRTLPETLLVVTDPGGFIRKVEVLSFEEPAEYLPRPRWFEQFSGRRLDRDLAPGRGIPAVTGATLTSRAVTAASRRCLALHQVICEGSGCAPRLAPAPAQKPPGPGAEPPPQAPGPARETPGRQ
jgi:Na+-translocating ferredoxin:NAD+ oxidoreductase subunit G